MENKNNYCVENINKIVDGLILPFEDDELFNKLKNVIKNYEKQQKITHKNNSKNLKSDKPKKVFKIMDATDIDKQYRTKKYYIKDLKESNTDNHKKMKNKGENLIMNSKETEKTKKQTNKSDNKESKFYTIFSCKFAKKLLREGCIIADIDLNTKMSGVVFHFVNDGKLKNAMEKYRKFEINKKSNNKETNKNDIEKEIPCSEKGEPKEIVFSRKFNY